MSTTPSVGDHVLVRGPAVAGPETLGEVVASVPETDTLDVRVDREIGETVLVAIRRDESDTTHVSFAVWRPVPEAPAAPATDTQASAADAQAAAQ